MDEELTKEQSNFDKALLKMRTLTRDYAYFLTALTDNHYNVQPETNNAVKKLVSNYFEKEIVATAYEIILSSDVEKNPIPQELQDFVENLPF